MGNINVSEETWDVTLALKKATRVNDYELIRTLTVQQFVLSTLTLQTTIGKKDYEALCAQETARRAQMTGQVVMVTAAGRKMLERKVDTLLDEELKRVEAQSEKAKQQFAEVQVKVSALLKKLGALEDVSEDLQEMLNAGCTRVELEGIFEDGELEMAFKTKDEIQDLMDQLKFDMQMDQCDAALAELEMARLRKRLQDLE